MALGRPMCSSGYNLYETDDEDDIPGKDIGYFLSRKNASAAAGSNSFHKS